jgi:tetratricopeptide (TPR) repeat protein
MTDTIRCPDCGAENPAGSASCGNCNFPLAEPAPSVPPGPESEPEVVIRRPVRRPRPRPGPPVNSTSLSLWLFFGVAAAAALVWTGYSSFRKNNAPPIEGSSGDQRHLADSLQAVLERDSSDVDANIAYANILYDTANWPDAVRFYSRAIARDSARVEAIVDLGVCYYNQGQFERAEEIFLLALVREPHQPVALFNLGVVNERRGDGEAALRYLHRALESDPPEPMKQAILERMQKLLQKTGKKAPPLDQGAMPPGTPGMPPGQMPPSGTPPAGARPGR